MRRKKTLSPNAERRAQARAQAKIGRAREQLADREDGGRPDRPIEIVSATLVETRARSLACPRCLGPNRIDEHVAETIEGKRLRIAHVTCSSCGTRRAIYFRIIGDAPN